MSDQSEIPLDGVAVDHLISELQKLPSKSYLTRDDESSKWDVWIGKEWIGGLPYDGYFYTAESLKRKKSS